MHDFIVGDSFILITGLSSVISLIISVFVASKVIKIDKSVNIKNQKITVSGNDNKTAGGNNV